MASTPLSPTSSKTEDIRRRPGCLIAYAGLMALGVLGAIFLGLARLFVALSSRELTSNDAWFFTILVVYVAISLVVLTGLWQLRNWARLFVIVVAALSVVWLIFVLITQLPVFSPEEMATSAVASVFPLLANGLVVYWFATHRRVFH